MGGLLRQRRIAVTGLRSRRLIWMRPVRQVTFGTGAEREAAKQHHQPDTPPDTPTLAKARNTRRETQHNTQHSSSRRVPQDSAFGRRARAIGGNAVIGGVLGENIHYILPHSSFA